MLIVSPSVVDRGYSQKELVLQELRPVNQPEYACRDEKKLTFKRGETDT